MRAIGEPAAARRNPYFDGDELVVPVYEERVVSERRLFLKEEIRLRRARHVFQEQHDIPVRRERAVFERLQADGSWREVPLSLARRLPSRPRRTRALRRPSDHLPFHLQESSMNQTVVGVFNSHEAAERAAETLANQGFERRRMHVKSTGADSTGTVSDTTGTASQDGESTGVMASIRHFFAELFGDEDEQRASYAEAVRRGGAVLAVEVEDSRIDAARDALMQCGAIDIEEQVSSWRGRAGRATTPSAAPYSREQAAAERQNVVPVVEEQLEVGKRQVSGGAVRVVSRVVSRPVSESVELRREEATVERHAVDRPATEADLAAMQERTIEVTEMAERPVVSKSARVVEEVVVGKQVSSETQTVEDTVRRTEVEVERVGGDESRGPSTHRRWPGHGRRRWRQRWAWRWRWRWRGTGREQIGATQVTPRPERWARRARVVPAPVR